MDIKKIHVELTQDQKKLVIEYMLGAISKGIFEDCPEFWLITSKELYSSYYEAVENFIEQIKEHLLNTI